MKVVVIGASGRTGEQIARQLLEADDHVVAIVRDAGRAADMNDRGALIVELDFSTARVNELAGAMSGMDGVIFAAGGDLDAVDQIDRAGAIKAMAAAGRASVDRFVHISAIGTGGERLGDLAAPKWAGYYVAKRAAEDHLKASHLKWTILKPGWLVDDAATGHVVMAEHGLNLNSIPRADVAALAVFALHDPRTVGQSWEVTAGSQTIKNAIDEQLTRSATQGTLTSDGGVPPVPPPPSV